jgi:phospholipid/cholesterol/gamma-HCH transport system ATP-binding protein
VSEDRREEERVQEREADPEAETRPLDARDWEETRGEQEQEAKPRGTGEMTHERGSQAEADEYQWHTGTKREHGSDDAVEFIDVVKAFGRNRVLNGLNLGLPDNQISMILGPSGTGKSVCIKHMVGLL